jgi:hypothetical protein
MTERRSFKMHPQLLYSVIQRQAGSLAKAILEGVMNSVDARADRVDITLTSTTLTLQDTGHGFTDRTQIEQFFETFGQPHDAGEAKIYGCFRMGRGQLFSFGHNHWASGPFTMDVNIKTLGLDYDLQTRDTVVPGCAITVDLYDPLSPSELDGVVRELAKFVKYVSIPVLCNGEALAKSPTAGKWDHETDDAWVRFTETGGLRVYNLGVFVEELGIHAYGVGGEVVSKSPFQVNMARNQVQRSCPKWRRVMSLVEDTTTTRNTGKDRQTDASRARLLDQLRTGAIDLHRVRTIRLFRDVAGKLWSPNMLHGWAHRRTLFLADAGSREGDRLMQLGIGLVLTRTTAEALGCTTPEQVIAKLGLSRGYRGTWTAGDFDAACVELACSTDYTIVEDPTPHERVFLTVLQQMGRAISYGVRATDRRLILGTSDLAHGWTDGSTYIAVNREYLRRHDTGSVADWVQLATLLLHEYCHDTSDQQSHLHGPEFYETYHDASLASCLARAVDLAIERYPVELRRAKLKVKPKALKVADHLHAVSA